MLAACGGEGEKPPPAPPKPEQVTELQPAVQRDAATPPGAPAPVSSSSAVAVLQRYYDLIAAGELAAAYRLREPGRRGATEQAFAASFADYEEYRGAVGAASEQVTSGGWDYVEVGVQIIGRAKSGRPFSSAGTVTLRRRSGSSEWRVYPG